jgi:hypothetical protein
VLHLCVISAAHILKNYWGIKMVITRNAELAFQRTEGEFVIVCKYKFANGYGVSIAKGRRIRKDGSGKWGRENNYGSDGAFEEWTWELAVIAWHDPDNLDPNMRSTLVYDTLIADDVIGWQTDEEVNTIMDQVEKLPQLILPLTQRAFGVRDEGAETVIPTTIGDEDA